MDLDHIVLTVSSLDDSVRYYDTLFPLIGFAKTRPHVNGQGTGVDLKQASDPSYAYRREGVGLNHLAVRAASRAEIDAVVAAMKGAGFDVPEVQTIDGTHALFMKDRDGLRIEIAFEP